MSGVTAQSYGTFARLGSMSVSGSLTNNSIGTPVSQTYDAAGNVTTRTAGGSTDTLTWDAFGQLVKDVRTGTGAFTWSAVYDGLGRRLQTTQGALTVQSSYDPEVEFLELVTTINGARNWHVTGPDLDGRYGGLNGCGGVEAIYNQSTSTATYLLSDTYGHGEGSLNGTTFTWNPSQSDGYGALAGSSAAAPIIASSVLGNLIGWRGHYIDATGLYYLGARYYAPDSGTFLSPDPLGHSASMDLYSYCDGDPVNHYDADGRIGKTVYDNTLPFLSKIPGNNYFFGLGNFNHNIPANSTILTYNTSETLNISSPSSLSVKTTGDLITPTTSTTLYAPPSTDFNKIYQAGQSNPGADNKAALGAALGHYGSYDFQRNMGQGLNILSSNNTFYKKYTSSSNFAVGVYLAGAGLSLEQTIKIASTYAEMSSNKGDPNQQSMWTLGWQAATNHQLGK
jgi:RHS repeat-associated protein